MQRWTATRRPARPSERVTCLTDRRPVRLATASYVGGIVSASGRNRAAARPIWRPMQLRVPAMSPLPCAVVVAIAVALWGPGPPHRPAGAIPDDRGDDRVVGTIEGPVVVSRASRGARLVTEETAVWLWT